MCPYLLVGVLGEISESDLGWLAYHLPQDYYLLPKGRFNGYAVSPLINPRSSHQLSDVRLFICDTWER